MLHGINHNMFGKRDPKQYGTITLDEINASLGALGKELGAELARRFIHILVLFRFDSGKCSGGYRKHQAKF